VLLPTLDNRELLEELARQFAGSRSSHSGIYPGCEVW
jgi:hypothetical protein